MTTQKTAALSLENKRKHAKDLIIYFGIAVLSSSTNFFSRIIYDEQMNMGYGISIVIAYFTGGVVAFTLSKLFAFDARNSGNTKRELIRFMITTTIAMGVTWLAAKTALYLFMEVSFFTGLIEGTNEAISYAGSLAGSVIALDTLALAKTIAHIVGLCFGFLVNFTGHKFFTFK